MRRARRVDAGQTAIVQALRKAGCSVEVLSDVGRGVPDLLVSRHCWTFVAEVKEPGEDLTPTQIDWRKSWQGDYAIIHSPAEAIEVLKRRQP